MTVVWIVLVVALLGALAKKAVRPREGRSQQDLGFVSNQWVAEHRLTKMHDAQR